MLINIIWEKREKLVGGAGGRWDEEKPIENKPVESGGTIQPIRPLGVEKSIQSMQTRKSTYYVEQITYTTLILIGRARLLVHGRQP